MSTLQCQPRYELGPESGITDTLAVFSAMQHAARGFARPVSVLSLRPDAAGSAARFVETAADFARLELRAAARPEDLIELDGIPAAVCAPLCGTPLRRLLAAPRARGRALAPGLAGSIVLEVAAVLAALHASAERAPLGGVTTDAIWVRPSGAVLLLPSAACRADGPPSSRRSAPELGDAPARGAAADVYSLGLLLWDLLAHGRSAFVENAGEKTVATPTAVQPPLVRLVMSSLSADPSERPPTIAAFAGALARVLPSGAELPAEPCPGSAPSGSPRGASRGPVPEQPCGPPEQKTSIFVPVAARLLVLDRGTVARVFGLSGAGRWTCGRSQTVDFPLDDPDLSRRHFEIARGDDGAYRVRDLCSKNGLFINGVRAYAHELSPGDEVRAGSTTLRFEA